MADSSDPGCVEYYIDPAKTLGFKFGEFSYGLIGAMKKEWDDNCRSTWLGTTTETDSNKILQRRRSCFGDSDTAGPTSKCPFLLADSAGNFYCGGNNEGYSEVNKLTKLTVSGLKCPRKANGFENSPYVVANGTAPTAPTGAGNRGTIGGSIGAGPEWTGDEGGA